MQFYRRKKKSRSPLRSGVAIYGPDRYKRHAFCDRKNAACSHLCSKTSNFHDKGPKSYKNAAVLPSEKKVTLATPQRNGHLRSWSEQKACVLRWKTCCTFATPQQNVHFRPPNPRNCRFAREGRAFFFHPRFCARGTSLFGPTRVQYSKTQHFTRKVQRFFVRPSKIPNITDENALRRVARGQIEHREATPRPIQEPEKSILHR